MILDAHCACRPIWPPTHVAAIDPRMAQLPPAGSLAGDDGDII
jgi:hypothetical protein